jgi:cell division protein FtsB
MTQRRTPGGQGPARRPGQPGRGSAGRAAAARAGEARGAGRPTARDSGARRGEPRTQAAAHAGHPNRSASRPAAARRTAKRTTAPRPRRLTGRATVLLVILTALALGYTYPVRVYLDQESDIARIQAAQAEQRARIEGLREEVTKWQDDEYVRIQAKRRFYYVRPGEIPLVVWDSEAVPGDTAAAPRRAEPDRTPWYSTLWSSIQAADGQPAR